MRVFSAFVSWSKENKSCMRVDKRPYTRDGGRTQIRVASFHQLCSLKGIFRLNGGRGDNWRKHYLH